MTRLRTAIFAPIGVLALLASFAVPNLVDATSSHERFFGNLTGSQGAPPRTTPASGTGRTDLRDGNEVRYDINVHTNDGDATPNEGPGDFPGGEIHGQMLPRDDD